MLHLSLPHPDCNKALPLFIQRNKLLFPATITLFEATTLLAGHVYFFWYRGC
jgi:hypothetical protein